AAAALLLAAGPGGARARQPQAPLLRPRDGPLPRRGASLSAARAGGHQLRASYVWCGEVMGDVVMAEPAKVTVGPAARSTFVAPATLGLPDRYAILRPGRAGYVLTLSNRMSGTLSIQ